MTTRAGKMMLQGSPLFRGLPPATLERMAALATQRGYRRGEIVFSAGDAGDALFGVVSGRIRISTANADGREAFLNIMEPGDSFGEIALLDGGTRTATATATEASELVSIRREPLFDLLEREPKATLELLRLCGERLRWASGLLEDAIFLDAPARLAKRLLSLGELHGEDSPGGRVVRISQEELASFLGVSRQAVNEQLQGWKAKGWVTLGRGTVTVRDAAALRRTIERGLSGLALSRHVDDRVFRSRPADLRGVLEHRSLGGLEGNLEVPPAIRPDDDRHPPSRELPEILIDQLDLDHERLVAVRVEKNDLAAPRHGIHGFRPALPGAHVNVQPAHAWSPPNQMRDRMSPSSGAFFSRISG